MGVAALLRTKLWFILLCLPAACSLAQCPKDCPPRVSSFFPLTELRGGPQRRASHPRDQISCPLASHFSCSFLGWRKSSGRRLAMPSFFPVLVSVLSPPPDQSTGTLWGFGSGICIFRKLLRGCWCRGSADILDLTQAPWKPSPGWHLLMDPFPLAASLCW